VGDGVYDLSARFAGIFPNLRAYLAAVALGFRPPPITAIMDFAAGEFAYLPVIPTPGKILCVGHNYEEHRRETGRPAVEHPSIFTRYADTLVGHLQPILRTPLSSMLDFEGELAVVIGKPGYRIDEARAQEHVLGYSCFNDATIRDWQRHTAQFTPGKNFVGTGAFGPVLVTPDEVEDLPSQPIKTLLNGKVMQDAVLGDMIFPIARIIAYVSAFTPLATGDVIATGTPGGVGFKRDPQVSMGPGDRVEVIIGSVGHLVNEIAAQLEVSDAAVS
jgi:2-keto-4-pentenoate hydratase/2-oxohepta-3-ene-1,7-dioic acid hydratase in catechol pathway